MSLPKFWLAWRTTICVAAGAVAGFVFQHLYRQDSSYWLWLVLAVVSAIIAAGAAPLFKKLDEKREKALLDKFQVQLGDGLEPLLHALAKVSESDSVPLKHKHLGELVNVAIVTARHVAGQGRLRATYYRVYPQHYKLKERLIPQIHTGRGTQPQTEFHKGSAAGDHIFKTMDGNRSIFVPDTDECTLPGWDKKRERDYKAFVSVPVRTKKKIYGMLTVDAPEVGDLDENDEVLIRCVGLLLASGIAMVLNTPTSANGRTGK